MDILKNKDSTDIKSMLEHRFGNTFEFHPAFSEEFVDLVGKSGSEAKLIKQFVDRLEAIIALGNVDYGPKWIEHLKKYGNMYSLHLDADSKNYRLLFSRNKKGKYFLRMFYEKSGKKATGYAKNVEIAISRRDSKN